MKFRGHTVLPGRPYARPIRVRVFALLRSLGLEVDEQAAIAAGTRDDHVIETLRGASASVLLIPFHAHRDDRGQPVNGLGLLRRLREIQHLATVPVVMPISGVGVAAFELMLSREETGSEVSLVLERTFLLRAHDLDAPDVATRLGTHLARFLTPSS